MDDACPALARAAPPGLMKATTQPESELLFSISKNFREASAKGVAQRKPYGAAPLVPHRTLSPPAQLAAPACVPSLLFNLVPQVVKPHNAWCTFVTWIPPASGSDDDDFSYELNVRRFLKLCETCFEALEDRRLGSLLAGLRDRAGPRHPRIFPVRMQEPRVQLNGLEAGKVYFFQVVHLN